MMAALNFLKVSPTKRLLFLCLMVLVACACKPKEAANPWAGVIKDLDALNGLTVTIESDGETLRGMREGSRLPPGTSIKTEPGVAATIDLAGAQIRLDGASELKLERSRTRGATLVAGRLRLETGHEAGELQVGGQIVFVSPQSEVAVQAGPTASLAVLRGEVRVNDVVAHVGQAFSLNVSEPKVESAFDIAERVTWLNPDTTGTRGFGVVTNGPGTLVTGSIELDEHEISVEIDGGFALTQVTESFRNSGDPTEGVYSFEIPAGAMLTGLSVWDGGVWKKSVIQSAAEAERGYEKAKREGAAVAMLATSGRRVALKLGVVPADGERRVRVTIQQPLAASINGLRYIYGMPRDNNGGLRAAKFVVQIKAAVEAKDLQIYGYTAEMRQDGRYTKTSFGRENFSPVGDLIIEIAHGPKTSTGVRSSGDGLDYVALNIRPNVSETRGEVERRDHLVIFDTSRGRRGSSDRDSRILRALLSIWSPQDRVMVLACNDACFAVGVPKFVDVGESRAWEALTKMKRSGGTNVDEVARVAEAALKPEQGDVLYFTQGQVSAGALKPPSIQASVAALTKHAIQVVGYGGGNLDEQLAIANGTGGMFIDLASEGAMTAARKIVTVTHSPVWSDIRVTLVGATKMHPGTIAPITKGDIITVMARLEPGAAVDVQVSALVSGRRVVTKVTPKIADEPNVMAAKAWARARIDALEELGDSTSVAEAVALSVKHVVLSRHTRLISVGDPSLGALEAMAPPSSPRSPVMAPPSSPRSPVMVPPSSPRPAIVPSSPVLRRAVPQAFRGTRKMKRPHPHLEPDGTDVWQDSEPAIREPTRAELQGEPIKTSRGRAAVEVKTRTDGNVARWRVQRRMRLSDLLECYEEVLKEDAYFETTFEISYRVTRSGRVRRIRVEGNIPKSVVKCVGGLVARWYDQSLRRSMPVWGKTKDLQVTHLVRFESSEGLGGVRQILKGPQWEVSPGFASLSERWSDLVRFTRAEGTTEFDRKLAMGSSTWTASDYERAVEAGVQGERETAEILLMDAAGEERHNLRFQEKLVRFHAHIRPARACAHRRAADDLAGGELTTCGATSTLAFIQTAPSEPLPKTQGSVLTVSHTGWPGEPPLPVLLTRADGTRDWWLEPSQARSCVRDKAPSGAIRETCFWNELEAGVYALRFIGLPIEPEVTYQGEMTTDSHRYFVHGVVHMNGPDVGVTAPKEAESSQVRRALHDLKGALTFCVIGAPQIPSVAEFDVEVDVDGIRLISVDFDHVNLPEATECLRSYVEQIKIAKPGGQLRIRQTVLF